MTAVNDLAGALDAECAAIEALGAQFAAGFDRLEGRFDRLEQRFDGLEQRFGGLEETGDARSGKIDADLAGMRSRFDEIGSRMQQIIDLLTRRDEA